MRSQCCITTIIVSHQTKDRLEIILDRNCVVSHHYHHGHDDHCHGHCGHHNSILISDGPLKIFGACNFLDIIVPVSSSTLFCLTKICFSHQWSFDLKRSRGHSFEVLIIEPLVILHEKMCLSKWVLAVPDQLIDQRPWSLSWFDKSKSSPRVRLSVRLRVCEEKRRLGRNCALSTASPNKQIIWLT